MDEAEALFPSPLEIKVAGKALAILPVPCGLIPALVRELRPLAATMKNLRPAGGKVEVIELLGDLVAMHGENILAAVAIASGQPRGWVDGLNLAQLGELAIPLLEVNADFFVRFVAPMFERVATMMATGKVSPSSSSDSSATATAQPT